MSSTSAGPSCGDPDPDWHCSPPPAPKPTDTPNRIAFRRRRRALAAETAVEIERIGDRGCVTCGRRATGVRAVNLTLADLGIAAADSTPIPRIVGLCDEHAGDYQPTEHQELQARATATDAAPIWTALAGAWPDPIAIQEDR